MLHNNIAEHFKFLNESEAQEYVKQGNASWVVHQCDLKPPFAAITQIFNEEIITYTIYAPQELNGSFKISSKNGASLREKLYDFNELTREIENIAYSKRIQQGEEPEKNWIACTERPNYAILFKCSLDSKLANFINDRIYDSPFATEHKIFPTNAYNDYHVTALVIGMNDMLDVIAQSPVLYQQIAGMLEILCAKYLENPCFKIQCAGIFGKENNNISLVVEDKKSLSKFQAECSQLLSTYGVTVPENTFAFVPHMTIAKSTDYPNPVPKAFMDYMNIHLHSIKNTSSLSIETCTLNAQFRQGGTVNKTVGRVIQLKKVTPAIIASNSPVFKPTPAAGTNLVEAIQNTLKQKK